MLGGGSLLSACAGHVLLLLSSIHSTPLITIPKFPFGESTPTPFSVHEEADSISGFGGGVYDQD